MTMLIYLYIVCVILGGQSISTETIWLSKAENVYLALYRTTKILMEKKPLVFSWHPIHAFW